MSDLLIARHSAMVVVGGTPHRVRRGRTTAHADHPVVVERPDLWRPIVVDFPAEPASEPPVPQTGPSATKAVRAWAKDQGIEVPARGPLPDNVIAAYRAAHTGDG